MRVLLFVAGLVDTAFVAFHVFLGLQIAHWPLPAMTIGLLKTFNTTGTMMLAFLAFALLVRAREVMGTGLGAATLALGTLVYWMRAAAEFIWLAGSVKIAALCILAGLMHAVLFAFVRVTRPVT